MAIGLDFLYENHGQIDVSGSSVIQNGEVVEFRITSKSPEVYKVRLVEDTTVPPASEVIIKGTAEGVNVNFMSGMVEPNSDFWQKKGMLVGTS